jgi:hypothetical protein
MPGLVPGIHVLAKQQRTHHTLGRRMAQEGEGFRWRRQVIVGDDGLPSAACADTTFLVEIRCITCFASSVGIL